VAHRLDDVRCPASPFERIIVEATTHFRDRRGDRPGVGGPRPGDGRHRASTKLAPEDRLATRGW